MTTAASTFASRRLPAAAFVVAAVLGAVFAAALSLWAYYGTEVFFEMVRAGWMACF